MAWNTTYVASTNDTFTAAQWNQNVRDNLLETEAAKATLANKHDYFVSTGANAITNRRSASTYVSGIVTTSSTSYTDLASSSVTVTTGTSALGWISAGMANSSSNALTAVSFRVSGATTVASSDTWMISSDGTNGWSNPYEPYDEHNRRSAAKLVTGLNAGSNTFTMQGKVGSGTGRFNNRDIVVLPL